MKKIFIYLKEIADGGQSKVLIDIASGLAKKNYKVTVVCGIIANKAYIDSMCNAVEIVELGADKHFSCLIRLHKEVRRRKPDVLISGGSINNCIATLSALFSRTKVIVTEHISVSALVESIGIKNKIITPSLIKTIYPLSDVVVAVSQGVKDELVNKLKIKNSSVRVLYNPVVSNELFDKSREDINHKWFNGKHKIFLGVGRLHVQKSFETLIDAFQLTLDGNENNFKLIILGEGEQRDRLQQRIDSLGLRDNVDLFGRVDNPYAYMSKANVFVLSSIFEGLPTVLIEALACGTPVVSTNCPHGASEILEDGKWGGLVPMNNPQVLANAMLNALSLPRGNGISRAMDFSFDSSIQSYEDLIIEITEYK